MALVSYLTMKKTTGEVIKGDCTTKGHEETIIVYAFDHQIEIPRDTHTGLPTGQRVHHPLKISKRVDCASPLIQEACASGDQFQEIKLEFFRISPAGTEVRYYVITLKNAIVVSTHAYKPMTFMENNKPYHDMEDICFTYEHIIWSHLNPNLDAEDNWKEPKV